MSRKRALVGNAGDEEQQAKAKETQKAEEIRRESDLATVCATPQGRRFVWERIILKSKLLSKDVGPTDTLHYLAGLRYLAQDVFNDLLQMDARIVSSMIAENQRGEK